MNQILALDDSTERLEWFRKAIPESLDEAMTAEAAIALLCEQEYEMVFLDHDLGEGDGDGRTVARTIPFWEKVPDRIVIHSNNTVAATEMKNILIDGGVPPETISLIPFHVLRSIMGAKE